MNKRILKNKTKVFKAGESWNIRVTKKGRKALQTDKDTMFEKIVSRDGQKITFKKLENADPDIDKFMDKFSQKYGDVMKALENR